MFPNDLSTEGVVTTKGAPSADVFFMQERLFRHFYSKEPEDFYKDVSITMIGKTDTSGRKRR